MEILLSEHIELACCPFINGKGFQYEKYKNIKIAEFPVKRGLQNCYQLKVYADNVSLKANYYVGVDWLVEGEHFIQVKPKLNKEVLERFNIEVNRGAEDKESGLENHTDLDLIIEKDISKELNYLKLLIDVFKHTVISKETSNLVVIDWESKQIEINQKDDALTPFLVVQFLNLLKQIVRKGLKKSYYKVQENLNNRIKGKILVGANIKQNIFKKKLTKTYCEYQEFGVNHQENRFLKQVLYYCSNYFHQNANLFAGNQKNLEQLINFCKPAFEFVGDETEIATLKNIKYNPFFKEYKESVKIGHYILKRFAYNISNTAKSDKIKIPPFWIDMPKLFELYVYHHLLSAFDSKEIEFQFSTYGNALDFLITKPGHEMVVDAKYKMHYRSSHIHEDIRQVAGYARLNKVYEALKKSKAEIIDCLIVYPTDEDILDKPNYKIDINLTDDKRIKAYNRVFKIGIPMPYIKIESVK